MSAALEPTFNLTIRSASKRPRRRSARALSRAMASSIEALESRTLLTGSVFVTVLHDVNANGAKDPEEPALQGWTVFVDYDGNGTLGGMEPSAVTNIDGEAMISGVPSDTWDIRQVMEPGWMPAPGFDVFDRIHVPNNDVADVLFLNVPASNGSVEGTVWQDISGDGVRDAEDTGLTGWTVYLDLDASKTLDAGEPSDLTDVAGSYSLPDVAPGQYKVREIVQDGWDTTFGYDAGVTVDVTPGAASVVDFGNFSVAARGSISGTLWNDVNADGARAAGDVGMSGWTVFIDTNTNSALDAGEPSVITDGLGFYSFPSVIAGTYQVVEVLQPGWNVSPGYSAARSVTVVGETNSIANFANWTLTLGSISGKVWNDLNGDGALGAEPGLAGWTVFVDQNEDGVPSAGEPTATTDGNGNYVLVNMAIGSSVVREAPQIGWSPTAPGTGMQLVDVPNGTNVSGINFGNKQRTDGAISGRVFVDVNRNGIRDAGERGLAGIPVFLDLNNNGARDGSEPDATSSADLFYTPGVDETGTYSFTHLPTGMYHVRQTVPAVLSATPSEAREQLVDLAAGEDRRNVNFADVYRPNAIRGMVFNDLNKNHVRDAGEPGIGGVTIYIDVNRNNAYEAAEPRTITAADGTFAFVTNLAPRSYVLRQLRHSGHAHSYPPTLGGILWPSGVSNPAVGNVSPTSITTSLAEDQTSQHTVSLTLPGTGALTNMVDVFLLFDDTGSFTENSPIVRAAFPQIISSLQAALPGVDFGFGVGRFEEYANFASEYATGRPFILNQPVIAASTSGFSAAIQSALDRMAPGYGGDTPETDVEALFQAVTGRGFDGNNNGTFSDSGAAGLVSTQLTPGSSGDVPAFASFTVDPGGNVLPAAGTIGGAGFRAGALPIILLATDTGFAFQPVGGTTITGLNGLTLPLTAFTQTSRPTTPFASGAGIQETVTALNALGALVIGLGTNGAATVDPRQGLEAFANLTGAVNKSLATIPNGTLDPIAPGDPLYFQISTGFTASVSNGIVSAIQNGVSNVAVNIAVRASDPRVQMSSIPDVANNIGAGQTAMFDVTFTGDGRPHRFDLQFVREGTDVVLGSIPVVLGTPISGDGYEYEDLDEGEIAEDDDFGCYEDPLLPVNVAPSFVMGADQTVSQDAGSVIVPGWAASISPGPAGESDQLLDFIVTNDNSALFSAQPSIDADGTLAFTPAPGAFGSATVTVRLHDSGGTVGGGEDTSPPQAFTITVQAAGLAVTSSFEYLTRQALVIDFSADVAGSLTSSVLEIVNLADNQPLTPQTFAYDSLLRSATVTFDPATTANGNYRLMIAAGSLPNLASAHMFDFFVLAGDANRDRVVNVGDLGILATNWQQSPRDFSQADFNYDGVVNVGDLGILATNWQVQVAPPAVPLRQGSSPSPFAVLPIAQGSRVSRSRGGDRLVELVG